MKKTEIKAIELLQDKNRKPISAFNFKSPVDNSFKECWALDNLQPLWAIDNLRKGSKVCART